MKQSYLVIYKPGPAWVDGKPMAEQSLSAHGKYMLGLYQAGILRFAGPFGDDSGGAALIEAATEEKARAIANDDPAVMNGVFVYELRAWNLVPWENYVGK